MFEAIFSAGAAVIALLILVCVIVIALCVIGLSVVGGRVIKASKKAASYVFANTATKLISIVAALLLVALLFGTNAAAVAVVITASTWLVWFAATKTLALASNDPASPASPEPLPV